MEFRKGAGHLAAIITIFIWGTTFISTKILLRDFRPVEILFFRFVLGLFALAVFYPKRLKGTTGKQELTFAAAGLCGITLYYLLENIALTLTMASNVGVIISAAPFFTAIISYVISKGRNRLRVSFFIGFAVAMAGICLISFGNGRLEINPAGDGLALAAALVWAVYSLLTRKISSFGLNTIQTTRRVFLYGVLFMLPALFFMDFSWEPSRFMNVGNCLNLMFLGLGASALCFVTWNFAVGRLGAVKTSVYIYMVPVITVTASALLLSEPVTMTVLAGTALTFAGLLISELKFGFRKRGETDED